MDSLKIARVAFALPVDRLFDYQIPKKLASKVQKGVRVGVSFNKKFATGYVVSISSKSKFPKLNSILSTIDEGPVFSGSALNLAERIKDYYVCSLGEAIEIMLPHALKQAKNLKALNLNTKIVSKRTKFTFVRYFTNTLLLKFIQGEIANNSRDNKRVLIIVPEIKLVVDLKTRLEQTGSKIAVMHGKLSKKEALELWDGLSRDSIDLVIGTRSSIFTQIKNLSSIIFITDEDYAYKEDQVPYYNAINVAMMRSEIEGCNIVLLSQVPRLETYQILSKRKILIENLEKPNQPAKLQFTKINFKDKIDIVVENEIQSALENKKKILILLDRKGFATSVYCSNCKETLKCNKCSCSLRFEHSQKILVCPRCNQKIEITELCPKCNSGYVKYHGLGIEKLESNIKRQFPASKIISLAELNKGDSQSLDFDIIISTRKILNYGAFETDISIVWDFDGMLNLGDFRAGEETYQILTKLLLKTRNKMIISSSLNPDFYLFKALANLDYEQFYESELSSRDSLKLPPNYHLALVSIRSLKRENVESASTRLYEHFIGIKEKGLEVSEHSIENKSKIRGKHYRYLLLKSKNPLRLNRVLKNGLGKIKSSNVITTVNMDPLEIN